MYDLLNRLLDLELVRFLGAGSASVALYYLIYLPLTLYRKDLYLWWTVVAFVPSVIANFLLQRFWAFDGGTMGMSVQVALFLIKEVCFLGLNDLLLYILVQRGVRPTWAQVFITPVLGVLSYFITHWILAT
ncbi:GtrA family protein [Candidatus Kaiserbacteria bacterium]|nr:GtrA family protein [Candidatus Kaiserbacteria bacterium]